MKRPNLKGFDNVLSYTIGTLNCITSQQTGPSMGQVVKGIGKESFQQPSPPQGLKKSIIVEIAS